VEDQLGRNRDGTAVRRAGELGAKPPDQRRNQFEAAKAVLGAGDENALRKHQAIAASCRLVAKAGHWRSGHVSKTKLMVSVPASTSAVGSILISPDEP
jgi:hypothetical protein